MTAGRTEGAAPLGDRGLLSAGVEGTPDAVLVKDLEGRYLMVNSACARILGRPKEEIVGRDDAQILPPETATRLAEVDRLIVDTGEASSYEEVLPVDGGAGAPIPTMVLTANLDDKVAIRAVEAGAEGALSKVVSVPETAGAIKRLTGAG